MTRVGLGGGRPASSRRPEMPGPTPGQQPPVIPRHEISDRAWNEQMTRLLRESAEIREARERSRLREDELLARRAATALMDAIGARGLARLPTHRARLSTTPRRRPGR